MKLPLPRPMPPTGAAFAPAPELDLFVRTVFLDRGSRLFIEQHEILEQARIGYLWAWPGARDRGRTILGTAQLLTPPQSKWPMLRSRWQLETWFGDIDFLITLSAPFCAEEASDAEFLALLDHELSHCAQALDPFGQPRFGEDGRPMWAIRGHDVEQFVGVTERWGAQAAGVEQLVRAAQQKPRFGQADIARIVAGCGTTARAA